MGCTLSCPDALAIWKKGDVIFKKKREEGGGGRGWGGGGGGRGWYGWQWQERWPCQLGIGRWEA